MARINNGAKRATILDVAKAAGVSKTTVSRFLSNETEYIAEETYRKIESAIQSLNYRPNRMARGLKARKSHLIGFIVADIANPFSTAILRGAEDICHEHDYSLLVCNSDNNPVKEQNYIRMLQSHQIDGLVIHTTGQNQSMLLELQKDNTSIVLLDREVPGMKVDLVTVDNTEATTDALSYLLRQGYQQIAYFTQPIADVSTRTERVKAFYHFMNQYRLSDQSAVFEVKSGDEHSVAQFLKSFMERETSEHRAIFAGNAVMLLKVGLQLQSLGYKVPQDVALISFDDPEWAQMTGTSTVAQPTYFMGVKAVERLMARIQGDTGVAQTIRVPAELIERQSTPKVVHTT